MVEGPTGERSITDDATGHGHLARASGGATVKRIITPTLESMGFDLVRIALGGKTRLRLQVMIERCDRREVSVDDCTAVSHALSALLDVEDPIADAYVLEVSSAGLDRPLVRLSDFERFAGSQARLETAELIAGRRRYRGILGGIVEGRVRIAVEGEDYEVPFAAITTAKLVPTDEEFAASLKQRLS